MNFIHIFLLLTLASNTYAYPNYFKCDGTFGKGASNGMGLIAATSVMGEEPVDDSSILLASSSVAAPGSTITFTLESIGRAVIQATGGSLNSLSTNEGENISSEDSEGNQCTGTNQILYYFGSSSVEPGFGQFTSEWTAPTTEGTVEIVASTASSYGAIKRASVMININAEGELSELAEDTSQSKTYMYYLSLAALGVLAFLVCIWRRGRKSSGDDIEMDGSMRTKIRHESGI